MSLSKLSSTDHHKVTSRIKRAQETRAFAISTELFSESLVKLLNAHSNAIGVPPEFILWPLLTTVASQMGTNGNIQINHEWFEPSILWFVIAARKGEKKTAALKRVKKPVEDLQKKLVDEWHRSDEENKPTQPPQLVVDHFSFEELHSIMCRNRGQVLGLFDEMSSFYGQLDLYKHSSTVDRKTLLTLNGGGSWSRNFKSYSAHIDKTAFNVTGFIQPAFVYEMLNLVQDADGLNDRQLFDFPPERELYLDELEVPMPRDTPDLYQVFLEIYNHHKDRVLYTLEGDSYAEYRSTHDRLVNEKLHSTNEDVQGILSKSRGYCARIAMVIHALEQALEKVCCQQSPSQRWNSRVSLKATKAASAITDHLNKQKFIMLGVDETSTSLLSSRMCRLLSATWKTSDGIITPSEVSQKHLCERVGQAYPTYKALELLREAESLGYGTVGETTTPTKRKVNVFRKRKYEQLSTESVDQLKRAKLSSQDYSKSFGQPQTNEDHVIMTASTSDNTHTRTQAQDQEE